ncbi:hypothetical protein GYH30_028066 [Glycine max]|nr:hypothetical protein GYH30_028066 [Glycine max]
MAKSCSLAMMLISARHRIGGDESVADSRGRWRGPPLGNGMGFTCKGSIAECLGGEEYELDSEINRRILATNKYISYGALQRNTVPCSRRGASYYNCRPRGPGQPLQPRLQRHYEVQKLNF